MSSQITFVGVEFLSLNLIKTRHMQMTPVSIEIYASYDSSRRLLFIPERSHARRRCHAGHL